MRFVAVIITVSHPYFSSKATGTTLMMRNNSQLLAWKHVTLLRAHASVECRPRPLPLMLLLNKDMLGIGPPDIVTLCCHLLAHVQVLSMLFVHKCVHSFSHMRHTALAGYSKFCPHQSPHQSPCALYMPSCGSHDAQAVKRQVPGPLSHHADAHQACRTARFRAAGLLPLGNQGRRVQATELAKPTRSLPASKMVW